MKLKKNFPISLLALGMSLVGGQAYAQLSTNPDKFLGNITTRGQVNGTGFEYSSLWNQITPENESKWSSIEGNARGQFNWNGCDNAFNYAKDNHFPFKFHTLVWGSQYPGWMDGLSPAEQYAAIEEWMDAIQKRYPDLQMIDVVNEAIAGHAPAPYRGALGGEGRTGYDWIIKAFEMAHDRWPDAILIYNDYNTFQWQKTEFIDLVKTLRDAGAPIDAYGCQSHDLTDMNERDFKAAMDEIQKELQIPMYSTEYDIGTADDDKQLKQYKAQIPYMWEADYCAGITLWGYIYGATWTTDGNSGIIKDGKDRPAMTWLREYMATDAAKKAKSPFPGMVKEASVYIKPSALKAAKNEKMSIDVRASLKTKTIDHVDFYISGNKVSTFSKAPYTYEYTPAATGHYDLKAVVVATDGTEYTRVGGFSAIEIQPRKPFDGAIALPGRLEVENFDCGGEGFTYHDSDAKDEGGVGYRKDNGGVDIVGGIEGANSYAIGYTASGEWLEYTVDVKEAGIYCFEAYAAAGNNGASFSLSVDDGKTMLPLTGNVAIPVAKEGSWSDYVTVKGLCQIPLAVGQQVIRLSITGAYGNIDRIDFKIAERDAFDGVIAIPGIVEVENFDCGGEGLTFHDSDAKDEGNAKYRSDNGGVDIVACTGGYALGYTAEGEWFEYTVDVKDAGEYEYVATVSSGADNSGFSLGLVQNGKVTDLTSKIAVPNGGTWDTYTTVTGKLKQELKSGKQVIRLTITNPYCNIDKFELKCTKVGIEEIHGDEAEDNVMYNLTGQAVDRNYRGVVVRNGKKYIYK